MVDSFEVFRKSGEEVLWLGADATVEKALDRARKDMKERERHGCEYLILDLKSGTRAVVRPEHLRSEHLRISFEQNDQA